MMEEFAKWYNLKSGKTFDIKKGHIWWVVISFGLFRHGHLIYFRCLAHIINLAMQALISVCSKAKYYNPHVLDEHVPDTNSHDRDEIGLIHAIVVKVGWFPSIVESNT